MSYIKNKNTTLILAIETSCDETAAAVIKADKKTGQILVLSNIISSQTDIHRKYGGVIPEVAAREHVLNILPVIHEALERAGMWPEKLDYLAVTKGPGLITTLLAGTETVRSLAFVWNKPVIEVNHITGHIYANFINLTAPIKFPALVLTVSGGHTNLILLDKNYKIKIVGETLDDAAGEAFDKGAKMMGLGYPGGPAVSKLAAAYVESVQKTSAQRTSSKQEEPTIILPRPMLTANNLNFSFSGLKTALLYQLQKDDNWSKRLPEYCHAYQEAIIDVLVSKTLKAAEKYQAGSVMLSGGVSANSELRRRLALAVKEKLKNTKFFMPALEYTTDNAAMIGAAAVFQAWNKKVCSFRQVKADSGLKLK